MSDLSGNNYRLGCPFCKEEFLTRTYSKHIIDKHKDELFVNKHNKEVLVEVCNKKEGWWPSPLELKLKDKTQYFTPCCGKFYTKDTQARKHNKSKECREKVVEKAKELLASVVPINISNTHSGTGDIINNITQNITIVDLSGNILKSFKTFNQIIDRKNVDAAYDKKLIAKMQKKMEEEGLEPVSDVSSVDTCYDSDDECDTKAMRFDITKELPKSVTKTFTKLGIDLSRGGLGLTTKEEHDDRVKDKKDQEIEILEDEIISLKDELHNYKEDIKDYKERLKDADEARTLKTFENNIKNAEMSIAKLKDMISRNEEKIEKLKGK
jgi:hypothetical protein